MRLIAIFAFFICLIALIVPSLGQQTATDWLNEGQKLFDQGRYNEALQAYDEGIKLDSQWTDLYYHKGTAFTKLGMVDKAIEAFDMVNQINPKDGVVAYYWIGRTLSGAGRYDEAIQAYEKSTQSFNTYGEWFSGQKSICAQAWYYEGLAFDAVGRSDEAQNAYGNAIKLDPSLTRPVTGPRTPGTGTGTGIGSGGDVTQYCLIRKPYYPPQENCFEFYLAATTASAARVTAAGGVCSCTDIGVREGWEPDELYPGPFSTFGEGDAAMGKVSPYFDDAYGCHAAGGDTTGNELSIDASPRYNDLATTNTIRGFVDSDQVDVWVPFSFDFSVITNVDKSKIVMVVKPIGQLIGTDSLILKGASGEGRDVYSGFDALNANQWNTVEVDISGNSDIMDAIRTGHLEGVIEDDSAVQSVKLIISGTTIPHQSSGSIVGGAESG